jgi:hypothetical protein
VQKWLAEGKVYGIDAALVAAIAMAVLVVVVTMLLLWILRSMVRWIFHRA